MNKVSQRLALVLGIVAIPVAVWLIRGPLSVRSSTNPPTAAKADPGEAVLRDELNDLARNTSASLESDDAKRVGTLTRDCPDIKVLLEIKHVRAYLAAANKGEASPYHFVSADHRRLLQTIAGEKPAPGKVLAIRKELAALARKFEALHMPPDWSLEVEGPNPPPMPILTLLRVTSESMPVGRLPELRAEPSIAVFSGADGELLAQMEHFFNSKQGRAAFPAAKYPKLYKDGRIPPIPTALVDYRKEIGEAVLAEQKILLPEETPHPDEVKAVNEVFAELEQFLTAIATFGNH